MQPLDCVKELAGNASLGWTEGGRKGLLICKLCIIWSKGCPLWLLLKLSWCFRTQNEYLLSATLWSPRLCESRTSCCSQSLLFISSENWPSAALSSCCLLPPHPASNVLSPAPRLADTIPAWLSWNPHCQAHCHMCVRSVHFGDRMKRALWINPCSVLCH